SRQPSPASASISSSIGNSRSAWPLAISSRRDAMILPSHSKAAAQCAADVSKPRTTDSGNGPDLDHLGDVMAQQILDPHFQRQCGRGAARAGTLHMQIDDSAIKTVEGDVAAILCHGRTNTGIQQFL